MLETAADTDASAVAWMTVRSPPEGSNGVIAPPGAAGQPVDFRLYLRELRDHIAATSGSPAEPSLSCTTTAVPLPFAIASALGGLVQQLVTEATACALAHGRGGRMAVDLAAVAGGWELCISEAGFRPAAEGQEAVRRLAAGLATQHRVRLRFPPVVGGMRCVVTLAGPGDCGLRTLRQRRSMMPDQRQVRTSDGAVARASR